MNLNSRQLIINYCDVFLFMFDVKSCNLKKNIKQRGKNKLMSTYKNIYSMIGEIFVSTHNMVYYQMRSNLYFLLPVLQINWSIFNKRQVSISISNSNDFSLVFSSLD